VTFQVPQGELAALRDASEAHVSFITGQERSGLLSFLGSAAAADTRTFLAEIVIDNPGGAIPAGISAQVRIATGSEQAHFVSPSVVSLSTEGVIGVKTVENDTVVFHPVEIVRAEVDGVWVTGLPEQVTLITIGQGFVSDGEDVRATPEERAGNTPANEQGKTE